MEAVMNSEMAYSKDWRVSFADRTTSENREAFLLQSEASKDD